MPRDYEVFLPGGRAWRVCSGLAPSAGIIVPIDEIDGMTDQEIGSCIRSLIPEARRCEILERMENEKPCPSMPNADQKTRAGFVYLMRSGDLYKIGRSKNPNARLAALQNAAPNTIYLVHSIRTDDMHGFEAYLHDLFSAEQTTGEWFDLSSDQVAWLKGIPEV